MIWNLLSATEAPTEGTPWSSYILLVVVFGALIVLSIMNRKAQKKRQQETTEMLDAVKPGSKVKTIGGICGVVVEVCPEENTFVLETGSEKSGKSYLKFDKQAIYQTDATAKKEAVKEEVVETVEAVEPETVETQDKE